ncbi:sensitivity to high expression protein she9, partial [Modicella reniformis]
MASRLRLIRPAGSLARQHLQPLYTPNIYYQLFHCRSDIQGALLLRRNFSGTVVRNNEHSDPSGNNKGTRNPSGKDKSTQEAVEDDVQKKLAEDVERRRIEAQDAALKEILESAAAEKRRTEKEALKSTERARDAAKEVAEKQAWEKLQQPVSTTTASAFESASEIPLRQDTIPSSANVEAVPTLKDAENTSQLHKEGASSAAFEQESSKSLESSSEYIRSALPKNLRQLSESVKRKDYHDTIAQLSKHLNNFTGYNSINDLKHKVMTHGDSLDEARIKLAQVKQAYDDAISTRSNTQKAINDLLQRKHLWSPDDVIRFTDLYRSEHANEQAEQKAKEEYKQAESNVEEKSRMLTRVIMERYHEEQVWSDKIRAASTYGTWGLIGVNVMAFLIVQAFVEPRRRRKQVERYEGLVHELTERGILPEKKQSNSGSATLGGNTVKVSSVTTPPSSHALESASDSTPIAVGEALLGGEDVLMKMMQSVERQEERLDRVENFLLNQKPGLEANGGPNVIKKDMHGFPETGELENGSIVYLSKGEDTEHVGLGDAIHDSMAMSATGSALAYDGSQSRSPLVFRDGDAKVAAIRHDVLFSGLLGAIIGTLVTVMVMKNR